MHIFNSVFADLLKTVLFFTNDWFFAIAFITLTIKLLLFPLSLKQQRTLLFSQNLQAAKDILAKKFKNDSAKVNAAVISIMAKYKISPWFSYAVLIIQTPIFLSLYFSISNLSTSIGSMIIPWVLSNSPDSFHVLPVVASLLQGLSGLTLQEKNSLMLMIPILIGLVFLWKAPAGISVYWALNSLFRYMELRIFSWRAVRERYLKVPSPEIMIRETA
ncbi:YidC/Oxa1 family membrane protein insertase [Candidatus Formimonas warabiya]|uniref:Preprotein translocase YidC n=1 Tax=Formimonas warabiya TaxID=1761012 RepID=A0A3G1KYC8_FORW1|nr:YidC/Oxa1 family membrane protein insertase [Candidatus Formimonas warabiya]ATW27451.1 preprotein translocase YidC [Candidatus Formimonas warabiya]